MYGKNDVKGKEYWPQVNRLGEIVGFAIVLVMGYANKVYIDFLYKWVCTVYKKKFFSFTKQNLRAIGQSQSRVFDLF